LGLSLFWLFNAMESNPSASAQAAELATGRLIVVISIMGQQAPLGPPQGMQSLQLRSETCDENRSERGGQRRVGRFKTVRLDKNSMREQLLECINDAEIRHLAQRQHISQQNSTGHQNHHDPSAEMNLPNSRYFHLSNAFQHLVSLTNAVAQAFANPPPPPPRTMLDVMNNFTIASNQLHVDEQRNFVMFISFWTNILNNLVVEQANLALIGSDNYLPTDGNNE
jgi:hypothetical protein